MNLLDVISGAGLLGVAVLIFGIGAQFGREQVTNTMREEAVKRGFAEWYLEDGKSERQFRWKDSK